jgi:hypothetical protein
MLDSTWIPKPGTYIKAISPCYMDDDPNDPALTVGRHYLVSIDCDDIPYIISENGSYYHYFTGCWHGFFVPANLQTKRRNYSTELQTRKG